MVLVYHTLRDEGVCPHGIDAAFVCTRLRRSPIVQL